MFVDLASDLGEQGFKWIFVVHLHGAPSQHRALDDAGDYFHDQFGRPIGPEAFASTFPAVLRRAGYWAGYVGIVRDPRLSAAVRC